MKTFTTSQFSYCPLIWMFFRKIIKMFQFVQFREAFNNLRSEMSTSMAQT